MEPSDNSQVAHAWLAGGLFPAAVPVSGEDEDESGVTVHAGIPDSHFAAP
jgi:hypothetical protein